MTVVVYKSTDASAPTLQGIVGGAYSSGWADGSLLQLLRKCLVTGYGSKAAAGWSQPFTGTSVGVFRQGSGSQFYFNVLDDGSLTTSGAREASIVGFESMTAAGFANGTNPFPTAAQQADGAVVRKSSTADTVPQNWILIADDKTFMLFVDVVNAGGVSTRYFDGSYFGDLKSLVSGDAYGCVAIARIAHNAGVVTSGVQADTSSSSRLDLLNMGSTRSSFTAITGHFIARGYAQTGSALTICKIGGMFADAASGTAALGANTGHAYPNAPDMKLLVSRTYVQETGPYIRGWLRGLWTPESRPPMGEVIAGSGDLAGRTFTCLGLATPNSQSSGRWIVETSDTWD